MDGDALLKLVEATAKNTAIEVVSALNASQQVPEAVAEVKPVISERATHRRGWGDDDSLQRIIDGSLKIDLEADKYARSK